MDFNNKFAIYINELPFLGMKPISDVSYLSEIVNMKILCKQYNLVSSQYLLIKDKNNCTVINTIS